MLEHFSGSHVGLLITSPLTSLDFDTCWISSKKTFSKKMPRLLELKSASSFSVTRHSTEKVQAGPGSRLILLSKKWKWKWYAPRVTCILFILTSQVRKNTKLNGDVINGLHACWFSSWHRENQYLSGKKFPFLLDSLFWCVWL